jgi:5,10-methylenetetrahydromethanopterin reductase
MMRIGMMLSGARRTPEAVTIARRAEAAGIDDVWISEDYFERGAFTVASAVASATHTAQLGVGVVNPWTRHPMLTAMECAALDEMATGRAVLGVGASNRVWMQDRLGVPFQAPLQALEETVRAIRGALSGERVTMAGRHVTMDASLDFTPQRPSVPIYVGAKGRRALELTRDIGDGALLSLLSSPQYISWVRDLCGAQLHVAAYVLAACSPERAVARAAVRRPLAFYLGIHGAHDITRLGGLSEDLAGQFREGWLAGQPAEMLVGEETIDTFAVAGDVQDCLAGLRRLADAGLECAILRDPGGPDVEGLFDLATAYVSEAS